MQPVIYPYKVGSSSARALAQSMDTKCVYPNRRYVYKPRHLIINWGNSTTPDWFNDRVTMLNSPDAIGAASNKLTCFQALQREGVQIPDFTEERDEATEWLDEGGKVLVRHLLRASGGRGIELIQEGDLPTAPLYVKYVKKQDEYRVHVFGGAVIDVQQKRARRNDNGDRDDDINYQIRNHTNGWVFCREDVHPHDSIIEQSISAVSALGLDFGAVDVVWNEHYQRASVLEINTAPGLEGTTLDSYSDAIFQHIHNGLIPLRERSISNEE